MPIWAAASVPYFIYVAVFAVAGRDLPRRPGCWRQAAPFSGSRCRSPRHRTGLLAPGRLVLPPVVLLVAYRASGFLWRGPMFEVEGEAQRGGPGLRNSRAGAPHATLAAELLELAVRRASIHSFPIALAAAPRILEGA